MIGDGTGREEYAKVPTAGGPTGAGGPVSARPATTAGAHAQGDGDPGDAGWEARARLIRRMDEVEMHETEEPATIFTLVRQRP